MRTKKIEKRLSLNKQTIANMNPQEMNAIKGGGCTYDFDTACPGTTIQLECWTITEFEPPWPPTDYCH